jgi:DNA-binding transcriptional MerR regulator
MHIGMASRLIGRSGVTIRTWEAKGLITPARDSRGRRNYSDADLARLQELRLTIRRGRSRKDPEAAPR